MGDLLTQLLVACGLLYAVRELTKWVCPPVMQVFDGLVRLVVRQVRKMAGSVKHALWTYPVRQLGWGTTVWAWTVCVSAAMTLLVLVRFDWQALPGVAMVWLIVVGGWWVLRWWARRRHRVRVLPARRR